MKKIGFIGLGIMGRPIAANLLSAGIELMVNDVIPEAMDRLASLGAVPASVVDIGTECDIVFTIVPNGKIAREVILGQAGLASKMKNGSIIVDFSSVTPVDSRYCADELEKSGIGFLDAPVSGGEEGAINGTLAIMVGGKKENFEKVRRYFEIIGSKAILVGDVGSGSIAKLANQIIVNLNITAVAEALVFAKKAGADPQKVFEAISGGLADSHVLEDKAPRMINGNFKPGGKLSINRKDLGNVIDTAHIIEAPVPMSAMLYEIMQSLKVNGIVEEDHSAIVRYFETLANIDTL